MKTSVIVIAVLLSFVGGEATALTLATAESANLTTPASTSNITEQQPELQASRRGRRRRRRRRGRFGRLQRGRFGRLRRRRYYPRSRRRYIRRRLYDRDYYDDGYYDDRRIYRRRKGLHIHIGI